MSAGGARIGKRGQDGERLQPLRAAASGKTNRESRPIRTRQLANLAGTHRLRQVRQDARPGKEKRNKLFYCGIFLETKYNHRRIRSGDALPMAKRCLFCVSPPRLARLARLAREARLFRIRQLGPRRKLRPRKLPQCRRMRRGQLNSHEHEGNHGKIKRNEADVPSFLPEMAMGQRLSPVRQ